MSTPATSWSAEAASAGSVRARRQKKLRRLFWRRAGALAFGVAAVLALWQFWTAPWWYVQAVEIRASSPELRRAVARELDELPLSLPGRHLLLVHPWRIARELERLPQVRQVVVSRRLFPTRLIVAAQERWPMARLYVAGRGPKGVDGDGVLLSLLAPRQPVTPLRFSAAAAPLTPEQRAVIRGAVDAWQVHAFPAPGTLDIARPDRIQTGYRGVRWVLGDGRDLALKLALLPHLWPLADRYREGLEYVNVSDPKDPVLKMREPSPSPSASDGAAAGH